MRKTRKWWKEWAKIDLLGFAVGTFLVISFIIYRNLHPTENSPYLDLWPNVATDFLGVWLSVRLIDAIIHSREQHHGVRRELIYNLNYLQVQADQLLPRVSIGQVKTLKEELGFANERLPKRSRYLDKNELERIQNVFSRLEELTKVSKSFLLSRQRAEENKALINLEEIKLNQQREEISKLIDHFDFHCDDVSLAKTVAAINKLIISYGSSLTKSEELLLTRFSDNLSLIQSGNSPRQSNPVKPSLEYFSRHKFLWLKNIEDSFFKIDEWEGFNYPNFFLSLDSGEVELTNNELPRSFCETVTRFFISLREMTEDHQRICAVIPDLLISISDAKKDLLEETDID